MSKSKDIRKLFKEYKLEEDLLSYIMSYFEDDSNDFSDEGLREFLCPMLSESVDDDGVKNLVKKICNLTTNNNDNSNAFETRKLEGGVLNMKVGEDIASLLKIDPAVKSVDIRFTAGRTGKSIVDQKKLRQAEERLVKKREQRGDWLDADGIPIWNPDIKPDIIVNQAKVRDLDSKSKDIKIENFDLNFAGKKILQNATLALNYGRRYGIVGKNGIGKSTLLRAIAHKDLYVSPHIKILHVEQEAGGGMETSAIQSVLDADLELQALLKEEEKLNKLLSSEKSSAIEAGKASNRLKEIYQKLEELEADKAESRASAILNGLGFSPEQQKAGTGTFSGGWRMRLALARALFCNPDLLLADEVTNYLDFPAVVWLENYFQNWKGTILIVSHDRSFLDAVATDIIHFKTEGLEAYKCNFTTFVATRAEKRKNQLREYESQLQYRQHLQAFIDRWRYNANRAAQAQSKIKILEKLPPLVPPSKDDMDGLGEGEVSVYFKFQEPEKISPPILQMSDVVFGYTKERIILNKISFDIQMDSKVAIVGPNGAGKSTLIHLLVGDISPNSGICHRHGRLRIALFSQHHVDQLDLSKSSVGFLQGRFPGKVEEEYRRFLGRYGLTGTTALQPIGTLSGGQKSRVVFAWMAMLNPHILVLDEPTNHLDMDSIDALSVALKEFKGGILIVSHDQRFLDTVCNEVWVCQGGKLDKFEGKHGNTDGVVSQYKKSLLEGNI
ncbi:hypothetical protein HDU92_001133 [Lobulomyces angularis]|nr:hypothetical protein HDU92_001133 [Lobulomyces angularis]